MPFSHAYLTGHKYDLPLPLEGLCQATVQLGQRCLPPHQPRGGLQRRSSCKVLECSRGVLRLCWFGFRNRRNEAIAAPMHSGNEAGRLDGIA